MNTVVILRGPAGVGKSTISRLIREKLGVNWVALDVDKFKHYMPLKDAQSNRAERARIAQDVSKYFAKEMYLKGYDVILEEMYKKPYNDSLVAFLNENGMKFIKIFLSAPVEIVVERSASREKNPPEDEIRRHFAEIEPYADDLVIDTTKFSSVDASDLIIREIIRVQGL